MRQTRPEHRRPAAAESAAGRSRHRQTLGPQEAAQNQPEPEAVQRPAAVPEADQIRRYQTRAAWKPAAAQIHHRQTPAGSSQTQAVASSRASQPAAYIRQTQGPAAAEPVSPGASAFPPGPAQGSEPVAKAPTAGCLPDVPDRLAQSGFPPDTASNHHRNTAHKCGHRAEESISYRPRRSVLHSYRSPTLPHLETRVKPVPPPPDFPGSRATGQFRDFRFPRPQNKQFPCPLFRPRFPLVPGNQRIP